MKLERCVLNDIHAAKYFGYTTADEIAEYVCEKWKIDRAQDIREVYKAIQQLNNPNKYGA
jgi:hypothetical protein